MNTLKLSSFLVLLTLISADFSSCQIKNSKSFNLNFTREIVLIGAGAVAAVTAYALLDNVEQ